MPDCLMTTATTNSSTAPVALAGYSGTGTTHGNRETEQGPLDPSGQTDSLNPPTSHLHFDSTLNSTSELLVQTDDLLHRTSRWGDAPQAVRQSSTSNGAYSPSVAPTFASGSGSTDAFSWADVFHDNSSEDFLSANPGVSQRVGSGE